MKFLQQLEIRKLVAGHRKRNKDLLASLEGFGVDLMAPRQIDLHFFAPNEKAASELRASLEKLEFVTTVVVDKSQYGGHSVGAQATMSPLDVTKEDAVLTLVQIAVSHSCEHDGWGTPI